MPLQSTHMGDDTGIPPRTHSVGSAEGLWRTFFRDPRVSLSLALIVWAGMSGHAQQKEVERASLTVSGVVTDSTSRELLQGAIVTLHRGDAGESEYVARTFTNRFGFFTIPGIRPGSYVIRVRDLGYQQRVLPVVLEQGRALRFQVQLTQQPIPLSEIVVEGRSISERAAYPSVARLTPEVMRRVPTVGGEPDVLRSLQLLPGVKTVSEVSSGLYIRGGAPDETLTLLDGYALYDPTHLGGFLGVFNADAVKDVRLIKGGQPAEYGQRLSNVLDVTLRDGTQERISGVAGLSTLSARLFLEGPLSDASSFMVSGRVMYWDLLYPYLEQIEEGERYGFWDAAAKYSIRTSESDRFSFGGFFSADRLTQPPGSGEVWFDIGWQNGLGNIRWTHVLSPSVFLNLGGSYTVYAFDANLTKGGQTISFSDFTTSTLIRDGGIQTSLQWVPTSTHMVKVGLDAVQHDFELSSRDEGLSTGSASPPPVHERALELSGFLQDEWRPVAKIAVNVGSRLTYFSNGGYVRADPRFSLSYALSEAAAVKGSVSMAHQFVHMVVRNDISLPTGIWYPATEAIVPSHALQSTMGVEADLFDRALLVTLDGYYKDLKNLYDYRDGADFASGAPLEEQLTRGDGWAYGVEAFVNKKTGRLTGWLGYTLAWTYRKFPELNGGTPFFPIYDRRHDIAALVAYRIADAWDLSASWIYGSGQAYSSPTGSYDLPPIEGVPADGISFDVAERNAHRLPPFHRLDVAVTATFSLFRLPWSATVAVYNVYDHANVYAQYVSFDAAPGGAFQPTFNEVSLFGITPTVGVSVRF